MIKTDFKQFKDSSNLFKNVLKIREKGQAMKQDLMTVTELFEYVETNFNELKVSKQTIYNYINKYKKEIPKTEQKLYFKQIGNTLNLTLKGQELILKDLGANTMPNDEKAFKNENKDNSDYISSLKETIETLNEQLKVKDEQLSIKDQQILNLTEAINASRQTEHNQTYINALETKIKALESGINPAAAEEEKKNIFLRLWDKITGN